MKTKELKNNKEYVLYAHIVSKEISGYDHDKYYIGITCNVKRRWEGNGCNYREQVFYNAIKKYGWNNIKHIILRENLTIEEACILEKEKIRELRSNTPKYGYNMDSGGITCDYKGIPIAQYTKNGEFIRSYDNAAVAARLNGWQNIITHATTSHGFQWVQNANYEFPSKVDPIKRNNRYVILQYSISGNYIASYDDIQSKFNKQACQAIRNCCSGRHLIAQGFQWKYKNSDKIIVDLSDDKYTKRTLFNIDNDYILFMYDSDGNFIEKFRSYNDAGRFIHKKWLKIPKTKFLHIQNNYFHNYRWTDHYYDHLPPLYSIDSSKRKPVLQLDINNNVIGVYLSAKEAADVTNGSSNSISDCCLKRTGNKNRVTSGGYKWEYVQNVNVDELQISSSFLLQKITDIKSIINTLM